jgi:hypothetical protein
MGVIHAAGNNVNSNNINFFVNCKLYITSASGQSSPTGYKYRILIQQFAFTPFSSPTAWNNTWYGYVMKLLSTI